MDFQTRVQLPSGKTVSLKWLNSDVDRRNQILARIQDNDQKILCRCRREGLLIHIKRKGQGRHLARNPNSAALHHPNCDFYEPSQLVSGRFCEDENQKKSPRYLAHRIWEEAGFNQWSSGMVDGKGRSKRTVELAFVLASNLMEKPWTERDKGEWVKGFIDGEKVTMGVLNTAFIQFASNRHSLEGRDAMKRLASGMAQCPLSTGEAIAEFKKWACVSGEGEGARAYTFLTNQDLLPVSNSWELSLIDSLCREHSTVIRPIWYVSDKRGFPSAILIDDHRGAGVFVRGYHNEILAEACATKYHLNAMWIER